MAAYSGNDIALFIIAIFFPFISVGIKTGCGVDLLINLCLCALGAIPGIIHGFYIVHKYNDNFQRVEDHSQYNQIATEEPPRVVYNST
ncbi:hypothetical protein BDB01DRAFT_721914 [Pilobolus umbonatus]|nr:hypothetical protein BDB01DRAFT_721914 [Pilobolus umbonatus]